MKVINPMNLIYEDVECVDGNTYMVVHAPEIENVKTFDLKLLLDKAVLLEAKADKRYPADRIKAEAYREVVDLIEKALSGIEND